MTNKVTLQTKHLLLLSFSVLLLFASGCGKSGTANSPDMPEDSNAGSTVAVEAATIESTAKEFSLVDYIGLWADSGYSDEGGGLTLEVEDATSLCLNCISGSSGRIATAWISCAEAEFIDGKMSFSFEDDGWGNKGDVTLIFSENEILCEVSNVTCEYPPMWGIPEGNYLLKAKHTPMSSDSPITNTKCPSDNQIKNDLLYMGGNCFKLNSVDTALEIKTIALEFVRKVGLYDCFTFQIELGNEFYKVVAKYDISYFYDGENWIFNSYSLEDYQSYAIKSQIDRNEVVKVCTRSFDSYQITDESYYIDQNGVFIDTITFQVTRESKYFTEIYDCTYTYRFENDYWREKWDIEPRDIDWSLAEGLWIFEHRDEYIKVDIHDITQTDRNHIKITYSYETSPWHDEGPWEGYFDTDNGGQSRKETNLTVTRELDLYDADRFVNEQRYAHLDTYAFSLPIQIGSWSQELYKPNSFSLAFDIDNGFCIHRFKYEYKNPAFTNSWAWRSDGNEKSVYFKKYIDTNAVQDAIDKLKELNP